MIQLTSLNSPRQTAETQTPHTIKHASFVSEISSLYSLKEGDNRGILRRAVSSVGSFFSGIFSWIGYLFRKICCCGCFRGNGPRLEELKRDNRRVLNLIEQFPQQMKLLAHEEGALKEWWRDEFGKLSLLTRKALLWIPIQLHYDEPEPKLLMKLFPKFKNELEAEDANALQKLVDQIKNRPIAEKESEFNSWWKQALKNLPSSTHRTLLVKYAVANDLTRGGFNPEKYVEFEESALIYVRDLSVIRAVDSGTMEVREFDSKDEILILLSTLHKRLSAEIKELS